MRNEMIGAVVRRALEHPEFRRKLLDNPREALTSHGFALEDAELAEIEKIRSSLGDANGDGERQLVKIAKSYGVHPPQDVNR